MKVSWKQLLFSLVFEELVQKMSGVNPNNKSRVSKEVGSTSRSAGKKKEEVFSIAR